MVPEKSACPIAVQILSFYLFLYLWSLKKQYDTFIQLNFEFFILFLIHHVFVIEQRILPLILWNNIFIQNIEFYKINPNKWHSYFTPHKKKRVSKLCSSGF